MKHSPLSKLSETEKKNQVVLLNNMLFPFSEFRGNYADSCFKIRRELRNLCTSNLQLVIAVGRAAGLRFDGKRDATSMCKQVFNYVNDLCMSINKEISASFSLNIKAGFPTHIKVPVDPKEKEIDDAMNSLYTKIFGDNSKGYLTVKHKDDFVSYMKREYLDILGAFDVEYEEGYEYDDIYDFIFIPDVDYLLVDIDVEHINDDFMETFAELIHKQTTAPEIEEDEDTLPVVGDPLPIL